MTRALALQLLPVLALTGLIGSADGVAAAGEPTAVHVPSDAKIVDVRKDYGAVGDGVTDDTAAIQRAIHDDRGRYQRILYFPEGTYLVSDTLDGRTAAGVWRSRLTFQGAGRDRTIIQLKSGLAPFANVDVPKPVVTTGSIEPWDKSNGAGYNGFRNYLFDLTVDVGKSNPGAVGVDYLGNNVCGLENVRLRSSDPQHRGYAGLRMERTYVGPCLYENIEIDGFDYGIRTRQKEYSHTFEHLALKNQRIAGMLNSGNVVSIHDFVADETVPVLENDSPDGLVSIVHGVLKGRPGLTAIANAGALLLRDIKVDGYGTTVTGKSTATIVGSIDSYASDQLRGSNPAAQHVTLDLPIEETPEPVAVDVAQWKNAAAAGAAPDGKTDSTAALQAIFDSAAEVIYLPPGDYVVRDTIHIRGKARRIIGLGAVIVPVGPNFANAAAERPVFVLQPSSASLSIEGVQFGWSTHSDYPGAVWLEDRSAHTIVLRHVDFEGLFQTVYRTGEGGTGPLFLDDVVGSGWEFHRPQSVWARQLDLEGRSTRDKITNHGATLWVLGLKTEGPLTVARTDQGGRTEIIGALLYPVREPPPDVPAFIVDAAEGAFIYATSASRATANYTVQMRLGGGGKNRDWRAADVTARGNGSIAALRLATAPNGAPK